MQYQTPYPAPAGGDYTGDLTDNLTYMFKEPEWITKFLIGALVSLVPILNFVTAGYMLAVIKNVRDNVRPALPNWGDNFGGYFTDGLILAVIGLIYSIPLWILGLLSGAGSYLFSGGFNNSDAAGAAVTGVMCIFSLIAFVYAIALILWMQGVTVNYSVKRTFSSGFEFSAILAIIQREWKRMLMIVAVVIGISIVVGIVAAVLNIIPCLGTIVSFVIGLAFGFYSTLVIGYNCGFIARSV